MLFPGRGPTAWTGSGWQAEMIRPMAPDVGGVDVSGADVGGVDVAGVDVSGVDVSGADVGGVDVAGADVGGASPQYTTVRADGPVTDYPSLWRSAAPHPGRGAVLGRRPAAPLTMGSVPCR